MVLGPLLRTVTSAIPEERFLRDPSLLRSTSSTLARSIVSKTTERSNLSFLFKNKRFPIHSRFLHTHAL